VEERDFRFLIRGLKASTLFHNGMKKELSKAMISQPIVELECLNESQRVQSKEAVMLIKEPSLHGLIAKSIFPVLSRSGERLCARKNISPSLTLKSELEAMNIGRSNGLSFSPGIEL